MENISGTKIFNTNELEEAAKLLKAGQLLAFPTETVYGLGANAYDSEAVRKIFAAKKRPADNPLIIHLAHKDWLNDLIGVKLSRQAKKLINKFWPGPLTLILPKSDKVPKITTGGLDTVAVRIPDHAIARKLISLAGLPIAAPSANLSGRPSPTIADHVIDDLVGRIDGIIRGEQTLIGLESTVLDLSGDQPVLLRPGAITYEQLMDLIGEVAVDNNVGARIELEQDKALSPGMKYKHYSPLAEVVLVEGDKSKLVAEIKELIIAAKEESEQEKIGLMCTKENSELYSQFESEIEIKIMGSRANLIEIGNNIFRLLREFDEEEIDKIYIEGLSSRGIGLAIMNRLRKAAGYNIIEV